MLTSPTTDTKSRQTAEKMLTEDTVWWSSIISTYNGYSIKLHAILFHVIAYDRRFDDYRYTATNKKPNYRCQFNTLLCCHKKTINETTFTVMTS